jgi:hypothetical protein
MRSLFILLIIGLGVHNIAIAQRHIISGFVTDSSSGEALVGATVFVPGTHHYAVTNNYGFYSLGIQEGRVELVCSYVGYARDTVVVDLAHNLTLNIRLKHVLELQEVVVSQSRIEKQLHSPQMSTINLPMIMVNKLPSMAGEVDLLKVLQYYPGVSAGAEGSAGLYVRGGSPDQNLILLDGVPVYNISHLFGFVSVFNPDAVSNVQLYKGAFPARYGGRLSSVVDITMKEGNAGKFVTQGTIGPLASKLAFEGPLWKDKTSFIATGRRSLVGFLLQPLSVSASKKNGDENNFSSLNYYFYDANLKLNHRFSHKSRLYLGIYSGKDKLAQKMHTRDVNKQTSVNNALGWGNITGSMRWNYVMNPKLFSNLTLTYSRFWFEVGNTDDNTLLEKNETENIHFRFISGIEDRGIRYDIDYNPHPNHYLKMGGGFVNHYFTPGIDIYLRKKEVERENSLGYKKIEGNEMFVYVEDEFNAGDRFRINAGLHFTGFQTSDVFFPSVEPRISGRFTATDKLALKAAYAQTSQYVHLVSKSDIGLPVDIWLPVSKSLVPLKASQISLGAMASLPRHFDFSVEGYWKKMKNVLEYKEGSTFFSPGITGWEEELEKGKGWTYGTEFLLEQNTGNLTGWVAYTLSYNRRQFESLNNGKPFFYTYDRRHDFNIVLNYKFSPKSDIGTVWVFNTGRAHTLPTHLNLGFDAEIFSNGDKPFAGWLDPYTSSRNNYRAPSYHRLDISYNRHKKTRWGERTWSFGLYNAYNRLNAFHLKLETDNERTRLIKNSLFPIMPFINYSFKF